MASIFILIVVESKTGLLIFDILDAIVLWFKVLLGPEGFSVLFVIHLQHGMPFLLTAKKQHAKSYDANIHMPFYTTCPKADMPFYTTALKQT